MRIHFLITAYLPDVFGGAEVYTRNLAKGLQERGHKITINTLGIFSRPGKPADDFYEEIAIHRFSFNKPFRPPPFYAVQFWPSLFDEATTFFKSSNPDIIHITSGWFLSGAILAAIRAGIPTVGTHVDFLWACKESHFLQPDSTPCSPLTTDCRNCFPDLNNNEWGSAGAQRIHLVNLLARGYAAHHCPCNLMARLIENMGAPRESIHSFPYGIPDTLPAHRLPKTHSKDLRLGFIGRWNRIKGIHVLLDAMDILKNDNRITLTVFGEQEVWNKDSYGADMALKARSLPNVQIHGRFNPSDVAQVHAAIDVLVTPSIWPENSPVSILEALALGTPVICADGEGMTNLIEHGVNGLHFQSRNTKHLAETILSLANTPTLLPILQKNAKCLRTISDDVRDFETIYSNAKPNADAQWLSESKEFLKRMRLAEDSYLRTLSC